MIHPGNKFQKVDLVFPVFWAKMRIENFFTKISNFLLAISTGVEYLLLK
jgi:hypothetical protein